jgi:hypothetical protein
VNDEHFIEFTAVIGPISPPFKLHNADGNTAHGDRAERLFETVHNIEDDIDASAKIVTEDELDARADALKLRAENAQLRAVVDADDGWASVVMQIMRTIDGGRRTWSDPVGKQVTAAVAEVVAERDRLRAVVAEAREALTYIEQRDELADENPAAFGGAAYRRKRDQARMALDLLDVSPSMGGKTCPQCGTPYRWRRKFNNGNPKDFLLSDCECDDETPSMGGDDSAPVHRCVVCGDTVELADATVDSLMAEHVQMRHIDGRWTVMGRCSAHPPVTP